MKRRKDILDFARAALILEINRTPNKFILIKMLTKR